MIRILPIGLAISMIVVFGFPGITSSGSFERHRLYDISRDTEVKLQDLVKAVMNKSKRIVLVGEHHTNARHHCKQLSVIDALK